MRITYSILYLGKESEIFYRLNGISYYKRMSKERAYKFEQWLSRNPLAEMWPRTHRKDSHIWVLDK